MKPAFLKLEDGSEFKGKSPLDQEGSFHGEVVFTTGMTGYVETLTDPSYRGQIICFTYPLIGNYGVPSKEFWESEQIHARGVIVSEAAFENTHYQSKQSFLKWLEEQKVPYISDVDTRELTKTLREQGVMLGVISSKKVKIVDTKNPINTDLVSEVTLPHKKTYGSGTKKIIALDCGMKEAQMNCLLKYPVQVDRVPYTYDFLKEDFDALFISNGPGNPETYQQTIGLIQQTMKLKKPIFGICLGMQLLALAAGAKTYKLPYGHRGQNQPCMDLETKRCYITTQNHGFAVQPQMPSGWVVSFKNLNDGSVEGIKHKKLPFFSVQFHPEARGGPEDTEYLFEEFIKLL